MHKRKNKDKLLKNLDTRSFYVFRYLNTDHLKLTIQYSINNLRSKSSDSFCNYAQYANTGVMDADYFNTSPTFDTEVTQNRKRYKYKLFYSQRLTSVRHI